MELRKGFVLMVMAISLLPAVLAMDVQFNESGSKIVYLSVDSPNLVSFGFNVTGSVYNNTYPINVSVDVGNDGFSEWEYNVYPSTEPAPVTTVWDAWSNAPDGSIIDIINGTLGWGDVFGRLLYDNTYQNLFQYEENGVLGLLIDLNGDMNLGPQVLTITTNESTIHAFLPNKDTYWGYISFYVTRGGDTYYCNSEKEYALDDSCDLTPEQAIVPAYLARPVDMITFQGTERVKHARLLANINKYLAEECLAFPCLVPINVSVGSAGGQVTLDEFNWTSGPKPAPASISLTENANDYIVSISPNSPLTNAKYFYGTKPNVYVVPVQAEDETRTLTPVQIARINLFNNSLAQAWDELTNYSHPLDFTFFTLEGPHNITGFHKGDDYNAFTLAISQSTYTQMAIESPAIVIILDVWNYFPERSPVNAIKSPNDRFISEIYLNGIYNASITGLINYTSEVLLNVALHELGHSFISYYSSPINGKYLFYEGAEGSHPASFRSDSTFAASYELAYSPTGNEGYFEVYSVMNSIRVYSSTSSLSGRGVELSALDKMLLGTLSPDAEANYTFYEGNITLEGNEYQATAMTPKDNALISSFYSTYSTFDPFNWDVRTNSSVVDQGTSTSFGIPKSGQDNRALWVYANDLRNPDYFVVFNNNALSRTNNEILDKRPPVLDSSTNPSIIRTPFTLQVSADEPIVNCTLNDGTDFIAMNPINSTHMGYTWHANSDSGYSMSFTCSDRNGNTNSTILILTVDNTPPIITSNIPTFNTMIPVTLSLESNEPLISCSYYVDIYRESDPGIPMDVDYYTAEASWNPVFDSTHRLFFKCNDSVGNEQILTQDIEVDTTFLTLSLDSPLNETYSSNSVPASFSVLEEISECYYSLDGGPNASLNTSDDFSFSGTLAGLANGAHTFIVMCDSFSGNRSGMAFVDFSVYVAPPVTPGRGSGGGGGGSGGGGIKAKTNVTSTNLTKSNITSGAQTNQATTNPQPGESPSGTNETLENNNRGITGNILFGDSAGAKIRRGVVLYTILIGGLGVAVFFVARRLQRVWRLQQALKSLRG